MSTEFGAATQRAVSVATRIVTGSAATGISNAVKILCLTAPVPGGSPLRPGDESIRTEAEATAAWSPSPCICFKSSKGFAVQLLWH